MDRTDFKIIFDKLADVSKGDGASAEWIVVSEAAREELDEIAELLRLSNELAPPDVVCYTTT
jgi:hypothetical protein